MRTHQVQLLCRKAHGGCAADHTTRSLCKASCGLCSSLAQTVHSAAEQEHGAPLALPGYEELVASTASKQHFVLTDAASLRAREQVRQCDACGGHTVCNLTDTMGPCRKYLRLEHKHRPARAYNNAIIRRYG